jgi:hypothetical protein
MPGTDMLKWIKYVNGWDETEMARIFMARNLVN